MSAGRPDGAAEGFRSGTGVPGRGASGSGIGDRDDRLTEILDALPAGVAAYDRDGRLIHANPALWRQAGPGVAPLPRGATLAEVVSLMAEAGHYGTGDPAARVRAGLSLDRTRPRRRFAKNHMGCWHELTSTPLPGGGNVSLSVDVTAVRRTEAEAVDRAALLDAILERLGVGVAEYDHRSRLRYFNAAYVALLGAAPGGLRHGMTIGEVFDHLDAVGQFANFTEDRFADLPHDGLRGPRVSERRRADGAVIWVRAAPFPEGGHLVEVEDITTLRRAQEDVDRQAATLRAMLDNATDGLALFDAEGRLIAANARAARMVGLSPAEMTRGRPLAELHAAQVAAGEFDSAVPSAEDMWRVPRGPEDRPPRYLRRRPDGSLLEVRTDMMPEGGTIRTYRDVTEEHRVRAELEAARDAAEAASRAKSRFLATVTHELRTPLNAVIGFSEAIAEETRPERMRGHAAEVLTAGQSLLALVDGILEAARAESGEGMAEARPFDPAPVLRAAAAEAAGAAGEAGLTLSLDVPRRLPPVRGEQRGLRRVLDALLSNAVKFTPAGGTVALAAWVEDGPGGGTVVARVTDTGIGMAPEDVPRAMEAFVQLEAGLDRRYPGSGLGLYLARALAGAMGMTLDLETAPGAGTTARVTMRADGTN